jgi:enamine deaminase RidA (YjgF/YER057c/UK114 family)
MSADATRRVGDADSPPPRPIVLAPVGWVAPRGYSHGMMATGRVFTVAGQVGWDPSTATFHSADFAAQTAQALRNVVAVLRAGGAAPEHLVRLTWFIVDRGEYVAAGEAIGRSYREIVGRSYPPMSVVFVHQLLEEQARVEIEATAVVPE